MQVRDLRTLTFCLAGGTEALRHFSRHTFHLVRHAAWRCVVLRGAAWSGGDPNDRNGRPTHS